MTEVTVTSQIICMGHHQADVLKTLSQAGSESGWTSSILKKLRKEARWITRNCETQQQKAIVSHHRLRHILTELLHWHPSWSIYSLYPWVLITATSPAMMLARSQENDHRRTVSAISIPFSYLPKQPFHSGHSVIHSKPRIPNALEPSAWDPTKDSSQNQTPPPYPAVILHVKAQQPPQFVTWEIPHHPDTRPWKICSKTPVSNLL